MEIRKITFNEAEHSYKDEYNERYISVTQLIGKVEPYYDSEFWAVYRSVDQVGTYKARPFPESRTIEIFLNGKRAQYPLILFTNGTIPVAKSNTQVAREWENIKDEACTWGTAKHNYLEHCIDQFVDTRSYSIDAIRQTQQDKGFAFKVTNVEQLENSPLKLSYPAIYEALQRYVKAGWTIYAEKRVYSAKYKIAGTIDCLLVKGNKFYIIDWKTNRKPLKFEAGYYQKAWNAERTEKLETKTFIKKDDRLLAPLQHLQHSKGVVYTMQLSLYSYLCELWGLEWTGCTLVHIRPKVSYNGKIQFDSEGNRLEEPPEFYKIEYLKDEAHILCETQIKK